MRLLARFGWRSFFWLSLAMTLFNFVTLLLFFPETKFQRPDHTQSGLPYPAIASAQVTECKVDCEEVEGDTVGRHCAGPPMASRGRPSAAQFRLWQSPDPQWKAFLFRDVFTPIYVFVFPIILWAGLNVAGPANVLLYWNLTQSPVLSAPPYKFTPSAVGYSNFAFVVGGIIGLVTAGPLSDWVAIKATNRNNGIREAEMRLPALIPFFLTTVVGIVIGGVGYDRQWDWPVVLVVGYGLSGLCVTAVPTIAIAYAIDCYRPISGEIMVVATVIKNTCGFAMSYWVSPLAAREGWIPPTMVEFALTVGPMLLGIPIYLFGKSLRRPTRDSKVHSYSP